MRLFRTWAAAKALLAREEMAAITGDGKRVLVYRDDTNELLSFGSGNVRFRGAWAAGAEYQANDLVTRGGRGFIALKGSADVDPGTTSGWETYWAALSA